MSNEYKKTLQRFEDAVRDHAFIGTIPAGESEEAYSAYCRVEEEYKASKQALIRKLQYRALAAEYRESQK